MTTEYEEWKQEEETYRRSTNQELVKIDRETRKLQLKRDALIDEFRRWLARHKRQEPPKTGYPARMSEYIKGKEWLRKI